MKNVIVLAAAAMLVAVAPAAAKPDEGRGNGNHAMMGKGNPHKAGKSGRDTHHGEPHKRTHAFNARSSCPPGLARKGNGCMPPGQAKKLYNVGQRYNRNAGNIWSYNQIPDHLRSRYSFNQSDRYYYNSGYVYQVDPKTMLIRQVISAVLR